MSPLNKEPKATAGRSEDFSVDLAAGEQCDICGFPMLDVHCKLVCRNCGFIRDCSDP